MIHISSKYLLTFVFMSWITTDEELKTSSRRIKTSGDSSASNELNNLQVFGFSEIEEATNRFSFENKLGEGGFGPVYKVHISNYPINSSDMRNL